MHDTTLSLPVQDAIHLKRSLVVACTRSLQWRSRQAAKLDSWWQFGTFIGSCTPKKVVPVVTAALLQTSASPSPNPKPKLWPKSLALCQRSVHSGAYA